MTEFDLAARLNLTIRKNLAAGRYEIVTIGTGAVQYSYSNLGDVVRTANQLEAADYIKWIFPQWGCKA